MQNRSSKIIALSIALLGLCPGVARLAAQTPVPIFDYTAPWLYEQGGTNLPANWTTNNYNDAAWAVGNGVLGFPVDEALLGGAFVQTTLSMNAPAGTPRLSAYYFRKKFNLPALTAGTTLTIDCQFDDGGVIYFNGRELARFGMAPAPAAITYASLATRGGDIPARAIDTITVTPTNFINGQNVLAVEVHQDATTSSDIIMAMSASYTAPIPVTLTNHPVTNLTAYVGIPFSLTVGAGGTGPLIYQWQTNNGSGTFINIPGANTANYSATLFAVLMRSYRVIVSNTVGSRTSTVATVSCITDIEGPLVLTANVLDESPTNKIRLTFNESLQAGLVHFNQANAAAILATNGVFRVVMAGSNVVVGVTNSTYFPKVGTNDPYITLTMNSTNWFYRSNYYVVLNGIRDAPLNNIIAPNSIIPVSWATTTNLLDPIGTSQTWYYHANWYFERYPDSMNPTGPNVFTSAWTTVTYSEHLAPATFWGSTVNPRMTFELSTTAICYTNAPQTAISFQAQPSLFRTTFLWPTNATASTIADLTFDYGGDDAAAIFLNGEFLFSDANFPGGAITEATRATVVSEGACKSRTVPGVNLRRGSNVLAVAVAQFNTEGDSGFVCKLDAKTFITGPLPASVSIANINRTNFIIRTNGPNGIRVSWPTNAYGMALVYSTNVNSGPWIQEQPNMANPYITNLAPGLRKFYRLTPTQ